MVENWCLKAKAGKVDTVDLFFFFGMCPFVVVGLVGTHSNGFSNACVHDELLDALDGESF